MERINKKLLALIIVIVVLLVGGIIGLNIWRNSKYAKLVIDAGPSDLTMEMEGKFIKGPRTLYINPGTYTLNFTRKDFSRYRKTVTTEKGKTTVVPVALFATNEEGRNFLANNPSEQTRIERIGGVLSRQSSDDLLRKFPLIAKLPHKETLTNAGSYRINYTNYNNDEINGTDLTIRITSTTETAKEAALKWIRDQGFNPENYTIIYDDPLSELPHED